MHSGSQATRRNSGIVLAATVFLLLFGGQALWSQNLYDLEHSRKYAGYLYSSRQYLLAAEEYERLLFFEPSSQSFKIDLVRSYRNAGDLNTALNRIHSFCGDSLLSMPLDLAREYLKINLLEDSLKAVHDFINSSKALLSEYKFNYRGSAIILEGDYEMAYQYLVGAAAKTPALSPEILSLALKSRNIKFKSPFLAAGLSAIVPGSGKFYTKNWADGIISMLFVASNAWQAYRGFSKHGASSAYGWTFAGISASFYIGNIFGSAKAAKRYNNNRRDEINNRVKEIVSSDSF